VTEAEIRGLVAATFQDARWPDRVYCRKCHDADSVQPAPSKWPRPQDLSVYRCHDCRYQFSDLTGTVLEKTSRPLWLWAWVVLGGDPATVTLPVGRVGSQRARLRDMAARLADTALAKDWKTALLARGVRRQSVEPLVERWASGTGNLARGRHSKATRDPMHRRKAI
jgi:hypothetical protein